MIYFCLGRRLQGKTTLAYYIARRLPRRMIFDPRGLIRSAQSQVCRTTSEIQQVADALRDHEITEMIVTPRGSVESAFHAFCFEAQRWIELHPREPIAILIDEVRFMDLNNEALDWVLRCSPVDTCHIIFTGHRPKDIPIDIRGIADRWLLFSFTLPRDLDVIEEHCSPQVEREVRRLQSRQFVEWNDQVGKARVYLNPAVWYVPLTMHATEIHQPDDTLSELSPLETALDTLPLFE